MSLNEILELCEKHMSEGDYLKASNTLKNIHHNKPEILTNGDIQYLVNIKITDVDTDKVFYIRKVSQRQQRQIQKVEIMTEHDSEYHWINYDKFIGFITIWFKTNFVNNIKIISANYNCSMIYANFYKKMHKDRFFDENYENDDFEDIEDEFARCYNFNHCVEEYSNYCVERLKEIIKFNIIHQ